MEQPAPWAAPNFPLFHSFTVLPAFSIFPDYGTGLEDIKKFSREDISV